MHLIYLFLIVSLISCQGNPDRSSFLVVSKEELQAALEKAKPGDEIVMANGIWKDIQIHFTGQGTESRPITLRAETTGKVFIEGKSDLKLAGTHLVVTGFHFRNGHTPSSAVIEFRINDQQLANHCRVTSCIIEDFNQLQRDRADHWVEFWGRHNQLDHCYIRGKSNEGPTIRVAMKGNENIRNYHQIVNNHFGPRPRKGGPKAETIQLGSSSTSMAPSHTFIARNLFEKCNGEVEVISSKSNFNEFRNNVFYKCEGSLVMRHGNYCVIDGNIFIGDEDSENIGGLRIINTGHWVTNNYFYNLKGANFRSPLAVMNGIPKSPLNRYNQVTDVVIAYNTWINCESPWQFGVGANLNQKDVLPPSEIRSARPVRTIVANNIIYSKHGGNPPTEAYDKLDGIRFQSNYINRRGDSDAIEGLKKADLKVTKLEEYLYDVTIIDDSISLYHGFEFEMIKEDLLGNSRLSENAPGAISQPPSKDPSILDRNKYGPEWYIEKEPESAPKTLIASSTADDLADKITEAGDGDRIVLSDDTYRLVRSLVIDKEITVVSQDADSPAIIVYAGPENTPAFELHPGGDLTLKQVVLKGEKTQYAFAPLQESMHSLYNLKVQECEISNFSYVLKAYRESFADMITFSNSVLINCKNGIELSEETDDKGNYNVEFLTIDSCQIKNIRRNVVDYYRGGYDESTIGGNLSVKNSTFINCGSEEESGILLNTRGIVNVQIVQNEFKNNPVKLVALLWGAQNNTHSGNKIINSGKILVEENLKLKLVY